MSKWDVKARLVSLLGFLLRPGMELLLFATGLLAFRFGFGLGFEATLGLGFEATLGFGCATLHGADA